MNSQIVEHATHTVTPVKLLTNNSYYANINILRGLTSAWRYINMLSAFLVAQPAHYP